MRKNLNADLRKPEILESYYQVMIREGIEGSSIAKIAKRMDIHPSLVIHYFQNKNNMTVELVDLLTRKYEAPEFLQFDQIKEPQERFKALIDTIFSLEWSRTVDPGVHFGFYYLSFRNEAIRGRFKEMFKRFRDYLITELGLFQKEGVIRVRDLKMAADYLVTLMEGLEFHAQFLSEDQPFERFAQATKQTAVHALKNGTI